jgi:hypothetical protein
MAPRPPRRLRRVVNAGFALAMLIVGLALLLRDDVPDMLPGLCPAVDASPRYDQLERDDWLAVAAVFADIQGERDFTGWSMDTLAAELEARGFRASRSGRYERTDAIVDLIGPLEDDGETVEAALQAALASHTVVYYNGHAYGGELALSPPDAYRIVMLDSCWSAQHYGHLSDRVDLIANTERAITGSIYSLVGLLDGLLGGLLARRHASWPELLAPLNADARDRAKLRPQSRYPDPERYGLVGPCTHPLDASRARVVPSSP